MIKRLLFFSIIMIFFLSCSNQDKEIYVLLTNQPEVLLLAEYFNSSQEDLKILTRFEENISPEEIQTNKADFIIAEDIRNQLYSPEFRRMDSISREKLGAYPALFPPETDEKLYLLPLSFDVPVIIYKDSLFGIEAPFMIDSSDLEKITPGAPGDKGYTKIPFSPLWNPSYMRYQLQLKGEDFCNDGTFSYNNERMNEFITHQSEWLINNLVGGGNQFSAKYRYIPDIQLLHQGRIQYICMSLVEFLSLQESLRKDLQFSYLGRFGQIFPDHVIYGALTTHNKRRSREIQKMFIRFMDPRFQLEYINWKNALRIESFGFLGGLSSLEDINSNYLPDYFQELDSRVFQEKQLMNAPETPPYWSALTGPVVETWLKLKLSGEEVSDLNEFYREWDLQFIP